MNLLHSMHPVLGIFGIDDAVILTAIVCALCLVIIAACLVSIALDIKKHWGSNSAPPPTAAQTAMTNLEALFQTIKNQGGTATPAQCAQLRQLLDEARSAGVGGLVIDTLNNVSTNFARDSASIIPPAAGKDEQNVQQGAE